MGLCDVVSYVEAEKRSTCLRCRGVRRGTNSSLTSMLDVVFWSGSGCRIGDVGLRSVRGDADGDVDTVPLLPLSVLVVFV